ncbi:hypothetical protein GUJ93_ZPchr0002g25217 [Zizania palustris]|uniref:Uncharacterized protein n=1 Tax=Zizania palustris TaxID=103762 RepID=A0A8J5SCQ7_ZIZPA|nr:hypothetical protein GUJ93_ZPchr0002g25217 [Zizania palustris]
MTSLDTTPGFHGGLPPQRPPTPSLRMGSMVLLRWQCPILLGAVPDPTSDEVVPGFTGWLCSSVDQGWLFLDDNSPQGAGRQLPVSPDPTGLIKIE